MLAGAVVPAGISWAGAKMAGAVLAEANLTGCDLSGPPADLTDAHFSRQGVTLLDNAGVGGYDLASPADRVVAYDYDGSGKLDHLVCYRPGTGAIFIVKKNADGTFAAVYRQGDPGGAGIGGYSQQADFSDAYLPNADFTWATLRGATFDGAFMVECILSGADLTPAEGALATSLAGTFLQGTTWNDAMLGGADLSKAVITDARGMLTEQHYDDQGKRTQPFPMRYPASAFPALDGSTICPNGYTHAENQENGLLRDGQRPSACLVHMGSQPVSVEGRR